MMKLQFILLAGVCSMAPMLCAQQAAKPIASLRATAKGEMSIGHSVVMMSAMCDDTGNVYTRPFDPAESSKQFQAPVLGFTNDVRPLGTFQATDAFPGEAQNRAFFIHDGRVYVLAASSQGLSVVEFARDGSVKSNTKLQLDSFVEAWHFAVFNSGGYLLLGETGDHLRTPFTGVFAADGRLVKKIFESEDDDARQKAEGAIRSTLSTA